MKKITLITINYSDNELLMDGWISFSECLLKEPRFMFIDYYNEDNNGVKFEREIKDGPCRIFLNGNRYWIKEGKKYYRPGDETTIGKIVKK